MSVAVALMSPSGTIPGLVTVQLPLAPTVVEPMKLPSLSLTSTLAPISLVPLTVKVPSSFCVRLSMSILGGVLSSYCAMAGSLGLPFPSVATTCTSPSGCTVGDSIDQFPFGEVAVVLVVPFGQVTVTTLPGSAVPSALIWPSPSESVTVTLGLAGLTVSTV